MRTVLTALLTCLFVVTHYRGRIRVSGWLYGRGTDAGCLPAPNVLVGALPPVE
jgi:hypothetical protein